MTTENKHEHFDWWDALAHGHQKWNLLDGRAREAAAVLGYSQEEWDAGRVTHLVAEKDWADLNVPQQDAAKLLGFSADKWTRVASSYHKTHPHGVHQAEHETSPAVMPSPFPATT